MADDPAGLVSAYYQILRAGAGSYDPERLRLILVPDLDFAGPIAGHVRERIGSTAASRVSSRPSGASASCSR